MIDAGLPRGWMRGCVAALGMLLLGACLDNVGPRPRPGGPDDQPPTPQAPRLRYYELEPRVVTQGQNDSVRITVTVSGNPEIVDIDTRAGFLVGLTRVSQGVWSGKVAPSILLFGYHVGDLHSAVGFIELYANGETTEHALIINVRDATVPLVDPQPIATGIQATPHVVNIRDDSIYAGGATPTAPLKSFYSQYEDRYTFLAVLEQVQSDRNFGFTLVRNNTRGLGLPLSDNGGRYGSAAALQGIIDYPNDAAFDPAEPGNVQELAHRWINYLNGVQPTAAHPHWPLSDLASGMIGWSDPQTGEPLTFPFELLPQSNGTFTLRLTEAVRIFNDMELYLMGVLPADSVQPHIVFRNQNQKAAVRNNGVLNGPVDTVTVATVAAVDGARTPTSATAPHDFFLATIVLSSGRMLTREEMSYFEHMASRGEQRVALPYFTGLLRGTALPFYPATGGRGTLTTRLFR